MANGRSRTTDSKKGVVDKSFLREWLKAYTKEKENFERKRPDPDELEQQAIRSGYRTWRAFESSLSHQGRVLKQFVEHETFQKLWSYLEECDAKDDTIVRSYSAANGGVPARILNFIEGWYQTTKMPHAEITAQARKIETLCDELLVLIGQIAPPSGSSFHPVAMIALDDAECSNLLAGFDNIHTKVTGNSSDVAKAFDLANPVTRLHLKQSLRYMLAVSGINPLNVIKKLGKGAENIYADVWMPRKARSKAAIKTYFIRRIFEALPDEIGHTLLADVVSLVAETDCFADDVRKALRTWKAERHRQALADGEPIGGTLHR